jgi:hypothetical protein
VVAGGLLYIPQRVSGPTADFIALAVEDSGVPQGLPGLTFATRDLAHLV